MAYVFFLFLTTYQEMIEEINLLYNKTEQYNTEIDNALLFSLIKSNYLVCLCTCTYLIHH